MKLSYHVGGYLIEMRSQGFTASSIYNKYIKIGAKLINHLFTLPELYSNNMQVFNSKIARVFVDIGCYNGNLAVNLAQNNPEMNFLAIDNKYKRVIKTAKKIIRLELDNARVAICDARELLEIVAENSISGFFIFFPDPWQKPRHKSKRLISGEFMQKILKSLVPGGFVWVKTDNSGYINYLTSLNENSVFSLTKQLPYEISGTDFKTGFETMFIKKKKQVHSIILQKFNQ